MANFSKIPLLYIAGSSHSGSTLIDLVLGSHSLIESLGEAKKIPKVLQELEAGSHPRPLCSCHAAIADCDFWKSVLQLDIPGFAQGSGITLDSAADLDLARRALAFRGKTILLDSSKNLGRLGFLAAEPGFSTTCLHLTRDPRAVAYSAIRKLERSKEGSLPNRSGLLRKHAFDWASLNRKIRRRYRENRKTSYLHLRYEDFVLRPDVSLLPALMSLGLEYEPAQTRFRDFTHHNIEGNRLRLQAGSDIRFDSTYLEGLSTFEWMTVSLVLLPTLSRFGYSFSRKPPVS